MARIKHMEMPLTQQSTHKLAMPIQYELRRLFHLMNIQRIEIQPQNRLF